MRVEENMSNQEIAEKLNVHPDTVKRSLTWAKKAGYFVQYEDEVTKNVIPMALEALKSALADGDGELAIKVLEKTLWAVQSGAGKKPNGTSVPEASGDDGDFMAAVAQIRAQAAKEESTVDGETIEEREIPLLMETNDGE
jgi:DNA-binding Lrp family transcriptional regulator